MIKPLLLLASALALAATTEVGSYTNKASPYAIINSPGYAVVNFWYEMDVGYQFLWDQGPVTGQSAEYFFQCALNLFSYVNLNLNVQLLGLYNWAVVYKFMPFTIMPYQQVLRYVRLEALLMGTKFDVNLKGTHSVTLAQVQTQTTTNFLLPRISFYDAVSTWLAGGTYWPVPFLQNAYAGPVKPVQYTDPNFSVDLASILNTYFGSSNVAPYLAGWYSSGNYFNWWIMGTRSD